MWTIGLPSWTEFLVRAVIVYLFLLIALRLGVAPVKPDSLASGY